MCGRMSRDGTSAVRQARRWASGCSARLTFYRGIGARRGSTGLALENLIALRKRHPGLFPACPYMPAWPQP